MALAKAKEIVSSAPVVVFSKTNSGFCKWLKELLTELGASFKVIELDLECDGSDIQSALMEWTGQRELPTIFINGNHIGCHESTENFLPRMVHALEDASVMMVGQKHDVIKKFELSMPLAIDTLKLRSPSPVERNLSTSSELVIDSEDQEVSDDDDDRNHKHRRREAQPNSFGDDVLEQSIQPNRKRSKSFEGRQMFHDNDIRSNNVRGIPSKFEKRSNFTTPGMRVASDLGSRGRLNQTFRVDTGRHSDGFASSGRPSVGRGRGRSTIPWGQQDSKFSSLDALDFASQVASQGLPTNHSLFVGTGLPTPQSTQTASWGSYGFVPGMSNSILDPLQPLGLQGALQPMISPLFNMGMPRQRCRDFDERGFCLRGDMCPMDHGVNRIVVEDMQSLSQFNLPVSDPSSHVLGIQAGPGSLPSISVPSGKSMTAKDGKSMFTDDKLNGVSSTSGAAEADVYDPDQPLWNSEPPQTSSTCLMLPSPNNDELLNVNSSANQSLRLSNGYRTEQANQIFSQDWSRAGNGSIPEKIIKTNSTSVPASIHLDEIKEDNGKSIITPIIQQKCASAKEMVNKASLVHCLPRSNTESGGNTSRMSHKASRTLYVHGIPQKNNTKDALLSHFQKFGEVVDIYIPLNSGKAFVQYSKREEAEAALEAPDAVMGNRFIKLWWANRDRVHDARKSNVQTKLPLSSSMLVSSLASFSSGTDKEKVDLASPPPAGTKAPTSEILEAIPSRPKYSSSNGSKVVPPVQKKLGGLDILKEELHKKQEILAQKREEFRRQLEKYEKQATSGKKVEVNSEQATKKLKVDLNNEAAKTEAYGAPCTAGEKQVENAVQERNPVEVLTLPTSGDDSVNLQKSNTGEMGHLQLPKTDTVDPDSLPSSFRILPPLPDDFKDVAVLQEHFSLFGDLSSVVLQDSEGRIASSVMGAPEDCCAYVTFKSNLSAERAYISGNCWKEHTLHFMWLSDSGDNKNCGIQDISIPHGSSSSDAQADPAVPLTSSLEGNSSDGVISKVNTVVNGDSYQNLENVHSVDSNPPEDVSMETQSKPNISEECQPGNEIPVVEDKMSVGLAR